MNTRHRHHTFQFSVLSYKKQRLLTITNYSLLITNFFAASDKKLGLATLKVCVCFACSKRQLRCGDSGYSGDYGYKVVYHSR